VGKAGAPSPARAMTDTGGVWKAEKHLADRGLWQRMDFYHATAGRDPLLKGKWVSLSRKTINP